MSAATFSSIYLLHLFHGKFSSNLGRWLLLLLSLALITSCIAKSTDSAWDHPLDQLLPICIFVGYYESKLFQTTSKPEMYYCYMDNTFVLFSNEDECDLSLDSFNSLHPSLRFTFEKESNLVFPIFGCSCWKIPFQVHYFHLSETNIYRSISTLDFLQSSETQN